MAARFWIKLYIELLDDAKMARLPNHLWRRAVELFLLAGRVGDDGALPPVEEMAWSLRLDKDKLLEDLLGLAEVGVVQPCTVPIPNAGAGKAGPNAWFVTGFKQRQMSESYNRVTRYRGRYRKRYSNAASNEAGAEVTSTSSFESTSGSASAEEGEGGDDEPPRTPAEALLHPDVRVYSAVTGGRIPGLSLYAPVIDAVRFLRKKLKMDDRALTEYLQPFWLAWSSRKRQDGRPYDPGNVTWLTEWALNGSIPSKSPSPGEGKAQRDEAIRRVAREK
jgi:hypothetical protein